MADWIDLVTYSTRYGVSQSTLRRRIRKDKIPFRLEKGKYYLEDSVEIISRAPLFSREKIVQAPPSDIPPVNQKEILILREENRRLKNQIAELQTFVKALEAELDIS